MIRRPLSVLGSSALHFCPYRQVSVGGVDELVRGEWDPAIMSTMRLRGAW